MIRLGAALVLGATLGGCLLGPSADTSPEAAGEVYRAHPAAFDSLRVMALEDAAGHVYLKARAQRRPTVERIVSFGRGSAALDSVGAEVDSSRANRYRALLTEAGVEGLTAHRSRDGTYYVDIGVAASGIAVSGCTLRLVSGREPYESTSGNFTEHLEIEDGWFAEQTCT